MPRAKECATFRSGRKHFSRAWGRHAPPPSLSDLSPSFSVAFAIGWLGEPIACDVYRTGLWDYRVQTGNFAFAGIDMALWDLCGKACGQPVHRLFGGPVQEEIEYFYYLAQGTPDELRFHDRIMHRELSAQLGRPRTLLTCIDYC